MGESAADVLNETLAKIGGGATPHQFPRPGPATEPLRWDGVRWTRHPTGEDRDIFGNLRDPQPVDAGWLAVTHDGAVWVTVDVLDTHPQTGEQTRTLNAARPTSKDLEPYVDQAYLTDDELDHISPPAQRAAAEVLSMAASLIGRRTKGHNVRVDGTIRWLLAVVERLTSVMEARGWSR